MSSKPADQNAAQRRRVHKKNRAVRRARPRMSRLLAWLLAAFVGAGAGGHSLAQVAAGALPSGGKVVVGSGHLQVSPNLLIVQQHTGRLGLDWQSFNIGSDAMVEFRQPGADSVALNRVLGNSGSEIYGRLKANGQVFLSNPNGVLFAPGAKVDVGGLLATTLDISQQDFADGRYLFANPGPGTVVNQGSLQASSGGYLALLGNRVDNSGEMAVDAGSVLLASGRAATVSISGHGLISAVVTPGSTGGSVLNSGSIAADGGTVRLSAHSAQAIAASLVNNTGIVRANTLVEKAGEIWITGDHVATSGSLAANAPAGGDAGRIMVIGDLKTGRADVAGSLQAQASGAGAAGGFIETSAATVKVADTTRVSTLATGGRAGTWLIDPVDYTIAASGGDITGATLSANLAGGNVTIFSSQGSAGTAGDVNVNDTVGWSANRLTLNAQNNININATLNGSGTASLALEYGQAAVAAGNTSTVNVNAPVSLPAGQNFSTKLGSNGTPVNFNVITSLAALQAIDGNASTLAGHYALGADIDASSTAGANGGLGFNPIGNEASASGGFTGTFDGLGHSISGLTIARPAAAYVGLFASTQNATLRNFTLAGGSVAGQSYAGAAVGHATGASRVSRVVSSAAVTASNASGAVHVGGLVGEFGVDSTSGNGIFASSASGAVTGQASTGGSHAGGLVGLHENGQLVDATSSGAVTLAYTGGSGQVAAYAGGLVGRFSSPAGIVRGQASGNVTGNYDTGGLVGYYASAGSLGNSQASGQVSGSESVGGLVGYLAGGGSLHNSSASGDAVSTLGSAGGLVGYVASSTALNQVQASGDVTTSSSNGYAGGLVGRMSGGSIDGATASGKVTSAYTAGGLVGWTSGTTVANTTASGAVSAVGNGTVYAGGLIGYQSSTQSLTASSAAGAVFADAGSTYAGGLVGYSDGAALVDTHATGRVIGRDSANGSGNNHYAGGLVGYYGYYYNQPITDSSASGDVSGRYYTGGLVGYFYGQSISDSTASGNVSGGRYVGGLAGIAQGVATLSNLSANGSVSTTFGGATVGGLIGYATTNGALSNLSASGAVTAGGSSADSVGGLFGELHLNGGGLVQGFASGKVSVSAANSGQAGGLIGYATSNSTSGTGINDSAATGAVSGGQYSGGLVGYLTNTYGYGGIANSRASGDVTGGQYAGGLVGYHQRSQAGSSADDIANSHASGDVSGTHYVGGLVGWMYARNGIVGSYATGDVSGRGTTSTTYLGGLVGYYYGYHAGAQAPALLRESYASGDVGLAANAMLANSTSVYAGGLVGFLDGSESAATPLRNAYASGDVRLDNPNGRLHAGGLVGYSDDQKIANAYASGAVAAVNGSTRAAGGLLAGRNSTQASVADSYWDTTATGQSTSVGGGTGLAGAQMLQGGSYAGFDITNTAGGGHVWRIYDGHTAPLLARFLTPLTLSLADASKTYDGNTSFGNAALNGVAFPDRIRTAVASPDVGVYALSAANVYSQQNGYDLTVTGNANLTITPKALTLAGMFADKVYDGTRAAALVAGAQPAGLVAGEDLVLDTTNMNALFDTKNVGQNKTITVSGLAVANGTRGKASNYTLAGATTDTASITPATLTVGGLAAVNRVYDGSTTVTVVATPNGNLTGKIGNDDVNASIAGVSSGSGAHTTVGSGMAVPVLGPTVRGNDAGNYVIAGIDAVTVDITPRALTVNGLAASNRTYNSTVNVNVSANGATLQGAVAGDAVQLGDLSVTGTMADKHAGAGKLVTVDSSVLKLRGADAGNYTMQSATTTVDIAKYQTHVYAYRTGATDKVYDGTAAADVGLAFWSVYSNDAVGFTTDAPAYSDRHVAYANGSVTSKTIGVGNVQLTGADAGNYQLTATTANTTGTIAPKPLVVTGVAAVDRAYDGTVGVTVSVASASVDTSAILPIDQGNVTPVIPNAGAVVGTMADKHVGNNKAVAVPGFSLNGSAAGNYTLGGAGAGVTVNIARKNVTPTYTADDKVYDGNVRARVVGSSADLVAGDDVAFESTYYSQFWSDYARFSSDGAKNVGNGKTVQIVYDRLNGGDAGNYTLNYAGATATASITPKGVTAAFTGTDKVYDGTDTAGVTLHRGNTGIIGNDVVASTQTAVFTAGKHVGNDKAVSISGIALQGADAVNYTLNATTANTTADITPKAVTVGGITATNRAYDGSRNVALTAGTLTSQGFIANDDVQLQPPPGGITTGTVANKNVGSAKPVDVTGLTLAGGDAGNYVIDPVASGITVDITPRALTAAYTGVNRAYNGGVTAVVNGGSADLVAGDTVTFSQSAIFTGLGAANAGTNKPIAISNIALGGSDAANYALQNTTASASADITAKGLTLSYSGVDRVYNGVGDVSATVTANGAAAGVVAGDDVSFSQNAVFVGDGAAGNNKAISVSNIALGGAQAANYALLTMTASTSANITRRPIGVVGITATNRTYDGTRNVSVNSAGAVIDASSIVAGDQVSAVLPSGGISNGLLDTKDAGSNRNVTITGINLTGSSAANYVLTGASGLTVNIAPRALTAVYSAAGKVYDGSSTAQVTGSSSGVLPGDIGALGISAGGIFAAGKNAGINKDVVVSGAFLTGAERNNYTLLNPTGSATATISPRDLTPGYTGGSKVYDGSVVAPVFAAPSGIVRWDPLESTCRHASLSIL